MNTFQAARENKSESVQQLRQLQQSVGEIIKNGEKRKISRGNETFSYGLCSRFAALAKGVLT